MFSLPFWLFFSVFLVFSIRIIRNFIINYDFLYQKGRYNKNFINTYEVKLFEAFAGVGAQYKALKNIAKSKNWTIKSVGLIEWFVDAIIAYQLIHYSYEKLENQSYKYDSIISFDSKKPANLHSYKLQDSKIGYLLNQSKEVGNNHFDITKVKGKNIPKNIDIFTYSFPCQDLSNQGKQKGMSDELETRSGLLWEIKRILTEMKEHYLEEEMPKYLLMENVVAIKNKKHNIEYQKWINILKTLGYESFEYVLDSKYFNSCQSRKRVFLLSVKKTFKDKTGFKFKTIKGQEHNLTINTILEDNIPYCEKLAKYEHTGFKDSQGSKRAKLINYTNFSSENTIYKVDGIGPTLTASGALSRIKLFFEEKKLRLMTPLESFRYMGFEDEDFYKVFNSKLISKNKQYFIMGNSIVVSVLEAVFNTLEFEHE